MDDEKSKIGELNETLYSRTRYKEEMGKRSPVRDVEGHSVEEGWNSPELDEMLKHERPAPKMSPFVKKLFLSALFFFIVATGAAVYVFLGGATFVSSKNVDISVLGPSIVPAGETLELGMSIINTNNADLKTATLTIQYPQGARNPSDTSQALTFATEDLGVIKAGSEITRNISLVLLGTIDETKEIKFSIEYTVEGSNATFYKDKIYEVTIGSAPITFNISSPSSVTSGEVFTTTIDVELSSDEVLKNVVVKAEYPYGYSVTSASPAATGDNNLWFLGDMSPGDKKTVTLRGRLIGEDNEQRTFRFYTGVSESSSGDVSPRIVLDSGLNTVSISRPSLGLDIAFQGQDVQMYVAPAGREVSVSIRYRNNFSERLLNPWIEVSLSGSALDRFSVKPNNNGFYDSLNSKVIWEISNSRGIQELNPGEGGQVTLTFSSLDGSELSGNVNDIALNIALSGTPVGAIGGNPISVSESRTVRIASQVNLTSFTRRTVGPFENTGPMPPKAEERSTYTIGLNVSNTRGDFRNAKVTAKLGPSVEWVGASSEGENISYQESSNTITWDIGELSSGAGFSSAARQAFFQVAITPSIAQIGTAPSLVTSIVFTGTDEATNETVTLTNPTLTTKLSGDPAFIQGDDIVVR